MGYYKAVRMTPKQREMLRGVAERRRTYRLRDRTARALDGKRLIELFIPESKRYERYRLTDAGEREARRLGFVVADREQIVVLRVQGGTDDQEVYGYDVRESVETAVEFREDGGPMQPDKIRRFPGRPEPVGRVLAYRETPDVAWKFRHDPDAEWVDEFEAALALFERRLAGK